jgi:hypothetical protein
VSMTGRKLTPSAPYMSVVAIGTSLTTPKSIRRIVGKLASQVGVEVGVHVGDTVLILAGETCCAVARRV